MNFDHGTQQLANYDVRLQAFVGRTDGGPEFVATDWNGFTVAQGDDLATVMAAATDDPLACVSLHATRSEAEDAALAAGAE